MVYTLPHAIKEEKKNEEGVGGLNRKESKVGKLKKSEEEKRERGSEGLDFLFFSFQFEGVPRESILKERRGRNSSWAFKDRESPGEAFLVFLVLFV